MNEKCIKLEERMFAYVESAGDEGKNYVLYTRTEGGRLKLRFWNLRNRDFFPKPGEFIQLKINDLSKAEAELDDWSSLSLDTSSNKPYYCELAHLNEEDVPDEVRKKIKKDRSRQKMRSLELIKDDSCWRDKSLHAFLMGFFKREAERFTTIPAAVGKHHAYKGGLFIHTAHVFSLCHGIINNLMEEFDDVDSDVLYMAAWFHDTGKMEIYSMDGDKIKIDSEREKMTGHMTISDRIFRRAAEEAGLDPVFMDKVSHCILSHHDRREWGTVVEPRSIEAQILCRADFVSSRMPD